MVVSEGAHCLNDSPAPPIALLLVDLRSQLAIGGTYTPICFFQGHRASSRGRSGYQSHFLGSQQNNQQSWSGAGAITASSQSSSSVSRDSVGEMSVTSSSSKSSMNAVSASHSRRTPSMPPAWQDAKFLNHPDPAPHLNQGVRAPAPGPRINPNPPPPPQYAPHFGMPVMQAPTRYAHSPCACQGDVQTHWVRPRQFLALIVGCVPCISCITNGPLLESTQNLTMA